MAAQNVIGEIGFAFFEDFSDANDGYESGFESGFQLKVDGVVGLAEILAAFGVSDDDVGDADGVEHAGANLPGKGAFLLPVDILRANGYARSLGRMDGSVDGQVGGADDDFVAAVTVDEGKKLAEEIRGPRQVFCTSSSWRR